MDKRPPVQPATVPEPAPVPLEKLPAPQPIEKPAGLDIKRKPRWQKIALFSGLGLIGAVLIALASGWWWYQAQLWPADSGSQELVAVRIESGTAPETIGRQLQDSRVIRSAWAFTLYARLSGTQNSLQAGTYRLSPADSTSTIVGHLTKGRVDEFRITFYPGATLVDNSDKDEAKKVDVTTVLKRAGYSGEEIAAALSKDYDHPVFAGKPASADLEGYVYGETYQYYSGATVEEVLERTFDELYSVIQENDLLAAYKAQGLTLYEGLTLASIIQREVTGAADQKQAAQVFLRRLDVGMMLGSDVTYQYIADKTGVPRDPGLNSPYNTRRFAGLPPGPIAVPGQSSLLAVAHPAKGDYLYFLSGDDNVTYFARTEAEHQANIVNHCQQKCLIL